MKKSLLSILICVILTLIPACRNHSDNLSDFNETLYNPSEASGFSISGKDGSESTLLTVTNPWQGNDSMGCLLDRSPSPRDAHESPMPYSA